MTNEKLSALYYPFSRCIDPGSLVQMLLVFDEVTFLDPDDDETWRSQLMRNLEREDPAFQAYQGLAPQFQALRSEGVLRQVEPRSLDSYRSNAAALGAISDLLDPNWCRIANQPSRYRLPARVYPTFPDTPTWQIFRDKLSDDFVGALRQQPSLKHHLVREGGLGASWDLTYAAGSAASLNAHMLAASELGLAPVTDSSLHHRLLALKTVRANSRGGATPKFLSDETVDVLTNGLMVDLVKNLGPEGGWASVDLSKVVEFRRETAPLRRAMARDLRSSLRQVGHVSNADDLVRVKEILGDQVQKEWRAHERELVQIRRKLLPRLLEASNTPVRDGTVLGALAGLAVGSPELAVAGSVVGAAVALLGKTIELKSDSRAVTEHASGAVAFLSRTSSFLGSPV